MTNQPDLTAASLMFGKLIDTAEHQRKRLDRERGQLIADALAKGVDLRWDDIKVIDGQLIIDGEPAAQWLDEMTMD